jgi:hypothetical protein
MVISAKIWSEPELVILTRSRPEETVLTVCKGDGNIFSSASAYDGCWLNSTEPCDEITPS